ncbi:hypothetical protein ACFYQA_34190 [Streptomyces sp. NPDC005774]
MPDRRPRRSVLAAMAAVPLTGALSACTGEADAPSRSSTAKSRKATHIT